MKKFSWCIFILLCLPNFMLAQRTLKGVVIDQESQTPIPYANISIVNSDKENQLTGIDGSFQLEVGERDSYLKIEYIGSISKKIKIGVNDFYLVQLQKDIEKLDEVYLKSTGLLADRIIKKAIEQKKYNDRSIYCFRFSLIPLLKFLSSLNFLSESVLIRFK